MKTLTTELLNPVAEPFASAAFCAQVGKDAVTLSAKVKNKRKEMNFKEYSL